MQLWRKIQQCLRKLGMVTLAAAVSQLLRMPYDNHLTNAKALLDSHGDTFDACTAYFPLINDINLIEFMNGSFFL